MRQTEIENEFKKIWSKLEELEKMMKPTTVEKKKNDIPQENYKPSVESKGLPTTKEGVSTTNSGDGEPPVEVFNKSLKHSNKKSKK